MTAPDLSPNDLDAIQARADAATKGPWESRGLVEIDEDGSYDLANVFAPDPDEPDTSILGVALGILPRDAAFIAHARMDVPALLAMVREQQAQIGRVEAQVAATEELAEIVVGEDLQAGLRMVARGIRGAHRNGGEMSPTRIQRKRAKGWRMPENTVYVGRGSKWGNPYPIGSMHPVDDETWAVLNTETSIALYREHLSARPWGRPALSTQAEELTGKDLACWCPEGQPCHADVLLELANAPETIATGEALTRAIHTRRRRKCIAAGDHTDQPPSSTEPAKCPRCGL